PEDTNVIDDILASQDSLQEEHVFVLRPNSYSNASLLGTTSQDGLLPRLLQRIKKLPGSKPRFLVSEGKDAGNCLTWFKDLPGSLALDNRLLMPEIPELVFVLKATNINEV
ncbi:unnamed protein product, partial [Meganyctiphanes norvegica]